MFLLHQIHLIPEDIAICIEILLIDMNCFDFADEQFVCSRAAALYHAALDTYRTVCEDRRIYIFSVFPLQIQRCEFIPIPSGFGSKIVILFFETLFAFEPVSGSFFSNFSLFVFLGLLQFSICNSPFVIKSISQA